MYEEGGAPKVGSSSCCLGVRLPETSKTCDIAPDNHGIVHPITGGMSVAPTIVTLLEKVPGFIPARLRSHAKNVELPSRLRLLLGRAAGKNSLRLWGYGDGHFTNGALGDSLTLRVESSNHGLVEPATAMSVADYLECLANTRPRWTDAESAIVEVPKCN